MFTARYELSTKYVCIIHVKPASHRWGPGSIPCEICGRQSGIGTVFSSSTSVFLCHYHFTNVPYPSSSTRCYHQKDKRASPDHPKSNALMEISGHWIEKYLHLVPEVLNLLLYYQWITFPATRKFNGKSLTRASKYTSSVIWPLTPSVKTRSNQYHD